MASTRKRRLKVAVPFGLVAVMLSVTSMAFACTIMGGQTYITSSEGDTDGAANGWTGKRGGKITAWADGPTFIPPLQTQYMLMQERLGRYCMLGAASIGTLSAYVIDSDDDGDLIVDDIGTRLLPKTGYLKTGTGQNWKGQMQICFSNTGYAAWPLILTVV